MVQPLLGKEGLPVKCTSPRVKCCVMLSCHLCTNIMVLFLSDFGDLPLSHTSTLGPQQLLAEFRAHPNAQVAQEAMRLHALLLVCPATRSAATQRTMEQVLHTVRHLSLEVPILSDATNSTSTAVLDPAKTSNDIGHASDGPGLHDQLSSISTWLAAVDEAVTSHCDAAVCLTIWRQVVHLAPPTGKSALP